MISVLSITKKNNTTGSGMSEAKFTFEFDNASTLPVKIYIQGQTPYFIANDSIAKNVSTNTYYRYNAEETRWVKDVSITSLPSTSVGNVTITDNGAYNILNNEITGYSKVDVDVSGGGGGETTVSADVQFIDYDGTIIKTYSAEDFATLTQLPENPTHEGLIAQGWNWSLEDAKEYVASNGKLIIGQMYVTDDGKTRLYVNFTDSYKSPRLCINSKVTGQASVDWGDGSEPELIDASTGSITLSHTYETGGDYVITVDVLSGNLEFKSVSPDYGILQGPSNTDFIQYAYGISKIEIGRNISSLGQSFQRYYSLKSITIPNSIEHIYQYTFKSCSTLTSLTIPHGVTDLGNDLCYGCDNLLTLSLPNSVTTIGNNLAYMTYSLNSLLVPNSVTSLGTGACYGCYSLTTVSLSKNLTGLPDESFYYCYSLKDIILPESIRYIGTNAFYNCYSLKSIKIPPSVYTILQYAFFHCSALESLSISAGVKIIQSAAFQHCFLLRTIDIPNSVTSIGSSAFSSCHSLEEINIDNTSGAITGSPWGANGHCQINWLRS